MKLASLEPIPTQRTAAPRGRTGLEMVLGEQLGFQGRSLVLLVKQNERTLVREGQSGGSDPCAPLMGGVWKTASPVVWSKSPLQAVSA